jgi:hypothetical protein
MGKPEFALHISHTSSASVTAVEESTWVLQIPAHPDRRYYLAQLDDHSRRRRKNYYWKPPLTLSLQARASTKNIPGTWGFGFWNDPFGFLLDYGGIATYLPALPATVWFFHASPQNYLTFRDDLPANGFLAASFKPRKVSPALLTLASPIMALALTPWTSRVVRSLLRRFVQQDTSTISTDVSNWHTYELDWRADLVCFQVDGKVILKTQVSPPGPLALVIWVDNQYAALPPGGRLRYGTLPNPSPVSLQVRNIELSQP